MRYSRTRNERHVKIVVDSSFYVTSEAGETVLNKAVSEACLRSTAPGDMRE